MDEVSIQVATNAILARCDSRVEVFDLLASLAELNWEELIAARDHERSLRPCGICKEWKVTETFKSVIDWNGSGIKYVRACPECVDQITLIVGCSVCDKPYPALSNKREFVCSKCEAVCKLVSNHNFRARRLGLPATLTARQWKEIVEHFEQRCVYCGGNYECLEHYAPLTLGSNGTVANNCLPSCNKCNIRKNNRTPDQLDGLFPAENLARIREWLDSQVA